MNYIQDVKLIKMQHVLHLIQVIEKCTVAIEILLFESVKSISQPPPFRRHCLGDLARQNL